jgi:hypothetical protein
MNEYSPTQFKGILELLIPCVIREFEKQRGVTEEKAFELLYASLYCLEEYKAAENMSGADVIALFKKRDIISYITSCYNALHVMGGPAIVHDIKTLINGQ